jgi:hypothetical protein
LALAMIVTLEPDGSTTPNPSGLPTSFLADGTGYRVVMRFIQQGEGLISYDGLVSHHASYTAVRTAYATYDAIVIDSTLAFNSDVDIACVCSGTTLSNGRSGLFTEIEAASCELSIVDRTGLFDPRNIDTVLGPGRRVRAGTWVQVSVWFPTTGWRPMFTGLVDTWSRTINAEDQSTSDVRVSCTDFFAAVGAATFNGAVVAQLTGARANALLAGVWSTLWATTSIATGAVTLDARTLDDAGVLEQLKAGAAVEDGRVYVRPDGTLRIDDGTWRDVRPIKLVVLGIGATDFRNDLAVCTYDTIARTIANYTALLSVFLVYDDMRVCSSTGANDPLPTVCATRMTSADSSDDVVNEVVLEYQAPQAATGFVTGSMTPVVASGPTEYVARDPTSIARYGLRSIKRSDLTPNAPASVLPPLANKVMERWREGDATITSVSLNLVREVDAARYVTALFSGDVINVIDRIPEVVETTDEWNITTTEVAGCSWNITPTTFGVELILDELRAG